MPKEMEKRLKAQALKKFGTTTSPRAKAYIYGTMREETSWKPKRRKS